MYNQNINISFLKKGIETLKNLDVCLKDLKTTSWSWIFFALNPEHPVRFMKISI